MIAIQATILSSRKRTYPSSPDRLRCIICKEDVCRTRVGLGIANEMFSQAYRLVTVHQGMPCPFVELIQGQRQNRMFALNQ